MPATATSYGPQRSNVDIAGYAKSPFSDSNTFLMVFKQAAGSDLELNTSRSKGWEKKLGLLDDALVSECFTGVLPYDSPRPKLQRDDIRTALTSVDKYSDAGDRLYHLGTHVDQLMDLQRNIGRNTPTELAARDYLAQKITIVSLVVDSYMRERRRAQKPELVH